MTEETYNMLEDAVQDQLKSIKYCEAGSNEETYAIEHAVSLAELLISVDKDNSDYYDKEERRRIEEIRNKDTIQVERDKQKLTWGRVALEMAKVIVPSVVTMVGYNVFQKRILKFEETGRLISTASRELHLPNFLKR